MSMQLSIAKAVKGSYMNFYGCNSQYMSTHMWTKGGLDVYGDRMLLASHSCKLIKQEMGTKATFLSLSMQFQSSSKYKVCSMMKRPCFKLHSERTHHGLEASTRRALLLHFLAIFETAMFRKPLLVDRSARADEKSSYLLVDGPGGAPTEEVVLQGLPFMVRLVRPNLGSVAPSEEEVLSAKLKLLRGKASAFNVFVNLPDANEQTPITSIEYAGSYFHEPRRVKSPEFELQETVFRIGISAVIEDLGLLEQPSILVTFVPCGADKKLPVVLESLYIELE